MTNWLATNSLNLHCLTDLENVRANRCTVVCVGSHDDTEKCLFLFLLPSSCRFQSAWRSHDTAKSNGKKDQQKREKVNNISMRLNDSSFSKLYYKQFSHTPFLLRTKKYRCNMLCMLFFKVKIYYRTSMICINI